MGVFHVNFKSFHKVNRKFERWFVLFCFLFLFCFVLLFFCFVLFSLFVVCFCLFVLLLLFFFIPRSAKGSQKILKKSCVRKRVYRVVQTLYGQGAEIYGNAHRGKKAEKQNRRKTSEKEMGLRMLIMFSFMVKTCEFSGALPLDAARDLICIAILSIQLI